PSRVTQLPRRAQLELILGIPLKHVPRTFERYVLPLRKSLPVVRHENPPPIGMPGKVHAEHVVDLALEPVGSRPHAGYRRDRLVVPDAHLHAHALAEPRRIETVDHIEARVLPRRPVARGHVGT